MTLCLAVSGIAAGEELGREVFTKIAQPPCALCHTLQAAGATGTVGPSLDEIRPDRQRVITTVREGIGVMPSFEGKLSDEQIDAVAEFVAKAAGTH
ncbi:MAG: c-type cytochrome [Burkholderiaceae bacterium]|nr:c-type cytochrome [Burkholderiaceae bacterium]